MQPELMFVDRPGGRVAFRQIGDREAPPVLFVHGIGLSGSMWSAQVEALQSGFNVIVPDLRGHGASSVFDAPFEMSDLAADMEAIMSVAKVEDPHYVGCSMGANLGMLMGARRPFRSLVLANAPATLPVPPAIVDQLCAAAEGGGMATLAKDMLDRWLGKRFKAEGDFAGLVTEMSRCSGEGFAAAFRALVRSDRSDDLKGIASPALVVAGEEDAAFDGDAARAMAAQIPDGVCHVIAGAAHLPNIEAPALFNEVLGGFLEQAEARHH